MISPASSSNSTASTTTSRSTPITRAHTLFDCTPFALALFPALDSRKAKPGNGVHPRMVSYSPTERDEEPQLSRVSPHDPVEQIVGVIANSAVLVVELLPACRSGRRPLERGRQHRGRPSRLAATESGCCHRSGSDVRSGHGCAAGVVIVRPAITVADGAASQISWAPGWTPAGIVDVRDGQAELVGDDRGEHVHLLVDVQLDLHGFAGLEARAADGERVLLGDADVAGTAGAEVDGRRRALVAEVEAARERAAVERVTLVAGRGDAVVGPDRLLERRRRTSSRGRSRSPRCSRSAGRPAGAYTTSGTIVPVASTFEQRRGHRARVVAQRPDPLEVGVELDVHHVAHARVDDGDAMGRAVGVQGVGVQLAVVLQRREEQAGAVTRVVARVVRRADRLVDEAVLHEVRVGHEGDALEAEVGLARDVQLGEVEREVPLLASR